MSRRGTTLLVAGVLIVVLLLIGWLLPVPYVALQPGPVQDTLGVDTLGNTGLPIISVRGHAVYPTSGELDLLTVQVNGDPQHQPTLLQALAWWLNRDDAVVPMQLIYPPGQSAQQVNQQDVAQMQGSQQDAIVAAMRYLHIPLHPVVAVGSVDPGSPADGKLQVGDVVTAVDGHPVHDAATLRALVSHRRPGASVLLSVSRSGRPVTYRLATISSAGRPIIGVVPVDEQQPSFTVTIGVQGIGGPSAGMMLALGIIDKLTPGSLTAGRVVAGTGQIDSSGNVSPIGGIQQKVVAAWQHGASVFLAPASECRDAKAVAPSGLRVVPVRSLAEAVQDLQTLRAGVQALPSC